MKTGENECKHRLNFEESDFVCCPRCFRVLRENMPGSVTAYGLVEEKIGQERERHATLLGRYSMACMTLFMVLVIADGYFVSNVEDWHVYISTYYLFSMMGVFAAALGEVYSRLVIRKIYNLKPPYFAAFLVSLPGLAALFAYRKAAALPLYFWSFGCIKDCEGGAEQMARTADYSYFSCAAIALMLFGFIILCTHRYRTASELTQKAGELDEMCYAQENMNRYRYQYRMCAVPQEQRYGKGWYV